MAIELPAFYGTFLCSTGIKQYSFVDITSTGSGTSKVAKLIIPTTEGACIGVMVSSGTTGSTVRKPQTVQFLGIAKVRSGSTAIVVGDWVKASTAGRALRAAKGSASTSYLVGTAVSPPLSTKSDGSEYINVLLSNPGSVS